MKTTAISAAELFEGAYSTKGRRGEVEVVSATLEHLELLELSIPVCEKYGRLTNELGSKGSPIGDLDSLIASTAIVHRQVLLTKNKKPLYRVPGLVTESW